MNGYPRGTSDGGVSPRSGISGFGAGAVGSSRDASPRSGISTERRLSPLSRPRPLHVRLGADGAPVFIRLPGKPAQRVAAVRERWRIDDEWWRNPVSREYFDIVSERGGRLVIYRDLLSEDWFMQRE